MEALLNLRLSKAAPEDITAPQYDEKVYISPFMKFKREKVG